MGARHLTIIRDNGKMLHHYGQWDGYPSGQGVIVLETLKTFNERKFRQNFEKAKLQILRSQQNTFLKQETILINYLQKILAKLHFK
jgi:hypothetical protein